MRHHGGQLAISHRVLLEAQGVNEIVIFSASLGP